VLYSFSTIGDPFGAPIFGSGTSVTGTFSYDAATAASGTDPALATIYAGAISGLTGSVGGFSFSDPSGVVSVGNDITLATCGTTPCDVLRLAAEPVFGGVTTPDNLSGFTINGLQLINVRLFWIEGQDNGTLIGDFLSDQNLPPALPGFNGRLGLDFIDPQNPTAPGQFCLLRHPCRSGAKCSAPLGGRDSRALRATRVRPFAKAGPA
jgi:hypothetical protein